MVKRIAVRQFASVTMITALGLFGMQKASGLGNDFYTNKVASLPSYVEYPKGFEELVNATNRIAGYDVNCESVFFFCGNSQDFTSFLEAYSNIPVAEEHLLVLLDGVGDASSPWSKTGRLCDWKLCAVPRGRLGTYRLTEQVTNSVAAVRAPAKDHSNYVMVVHFWTGGRVALNQVHIPANVSVTRSPRWESVR